MHPTRGANEVMMPYFALAPLVGCIDVLAYASSKDHVEWAHESIVDDLPLEGQKDGMDKNGEAIAQDLIKIAHEAQNPIYLVFSFHKEGGVTLEVFDYKESASDVRLPAMNDLQLLFREVERVFIDKGIYQIRAIPESISDLPLLLKGQFHEFLYRL